MPRYAAFLRAINVGGRRVRNDQLLRACEVVGLQEVGVFRASGNLVFDADRRPRAELAARVEEGLEAVLGFPADAFLRTAAEVRAMATLEPFPAAQRRATAGRLQVALLAAPPAPAARRQVLALATPDDRLAFGPRELYWLPRGPTLESVLDRRALVDRMGRLTWRTRNTVEQIAGRYFAG